MYLLLDIQAGDIRMQDRTEEHIKNDLNAEIQFLENKYLVIKDFLAGKDYDICHSNNNGFSGTQTKSSNTNYLNNVSIPN